MATTEPASTKEVPDDGTRAPDRVLSGDTEMHARIRAYDWASTSLGPMHLWPQSLRATLKTVLGSRYPMILLWGPELVQLYNDAYIGLIGQKHPVLGRSIRETQSESWGTIGPMIREVMTTGVPNWVPAQLLPLERSGYQEESYFSLSYSAVEDDTGQTSGMLCVCSEVTQQSIGERRLRLLRDLALRTGETRTVEATCRDVTAAIAEHALDVPFAALYVRSPGATELELRGAIGVTADGTALPKMIVLDGREGEASDLPLERAAVGETLQIDDLPPSLSSFGGPWGQPVRRALVMPIASSDPSRSLGVLVAGISPSRALDEGYRSFYALLSAQVSVALRNAHAREDERRRAEALAELDRAKTTFFSNVSHEFRTPLTLILGPLEDALTDGDAPLPAAQRERVEVIRRNAVRMFKLVNTLLDFSRIEAGRAIASYEPTDLAALTLDLISLFRSAMERAGLTLDVDVRPLGQYVHVDREMWEKIVLNLLSNAVKFTLQGGIAVSLKPTEGGAQLTVRDTGTGIPPDELPHVFERFHRVRGGQARSHEGSGIGLALVYELTRLHGGHVEVQSVVGKGTTFTVSIPFGAAHLSSPPAPSTSREALSSETARPLLEEALHWVPAPAPPLSLPRRAEQQQTGARTARILVVDDNADLRDYICGLLSPAYEVEAVVDGVAALEAAAARRPDLVLSDVMMPRLDGLGLLRELRADPRTCDIPVILLSARAGEASTLDAFAVGADDYLVKPFSARELRARVASRLEVTAMRRKTAQQAQALATLEDHRRWTTALLNSFPVALALVNPADGALTFSNDAAAQIGLRVLPPDQLQERDTRMYRFTDPNGRMLLPEELPSARAARGEEVRDVELEWQGPSRRASLIVDAVPLPAMGDHDAAVAVTFRDVTDRKRLEDHQRLLADTGKALAESLDVEVTLRKVAQLAVSRLADLCSVTVLDEDGIARRLVVAHRDPAREAWFAGIIGKHAAVADLPFGSARVLRTGEVDLVPEFSSQMLAQAVDAYPGLEAAVRALEPASLLSVPLRSRDGIVFGALTLVATNESKRRYDEADRAAAEDFARNCALAVDNARLFEQAQQAIRLRDEFLSVASHELKTPLTPLLLQLRSLHRRAPDLSKDEAAQASLHKQVGVAERQARRLSRLIDELLDLSRVMGGRLQLQCEPVNLAEIVHDSISQLEELGEFSRSRSETRLEVAPDIVGNWDRFRVEQIVTNLLSNACKYGEGKPVTVAARAAGGFALIEVRDEGIGIAPEDQERIFAKFERAVSVRHYGGLGLGLFIVRQIVDAMGGTIHVESEPGRGATFRVSLPLTGGC